MYKDMYNLQWEIFMIKKIILILICFAFLGMFFLKIAKKEEVVVKPKTLTAMVIKKAEKNMMIQDNNNVIYFLKLADEVQAGDIVKIEYEGNLNKKNQDIQVKNYKVINVDKEKIPSVYLDNGIFKDYYRKAYQKLQDMTLDEKIGQILLVRFPDKDGINVLKEHQFGGYVFYAKDFENKSYGEVQAMMKELQSVSKIPILTAVDEEGGKVVRVSSNPNLAKEPFKASKDLYLEGGFDKIKEDTINKSKLLYDLGINLNLAPVVDVSTNPSDYMYSRAFGEDSELTAIYAMTVINASKGLGVSYTLKHFPGYGNNIDTHNEKAIDNRSYEDILKNDLPPFEAGINEGAEAILVSHNIVNSIDPNNPASLSINVHNLLRDKLKFSGIIITDDLAMGATKDIDGAVLRAILSGNDLIITTDYEASIKEIKEAINNNIIDENLIDKLAFRVIAWKGYKGLIVE